MGKNISDHNLGRLQQIEARIRRFAVTQPGGENSLILYENEDILFEVGAVNYIKAPSGRGKSLLLKLLTATLPSSDRMEIEAEVTWHFDTGKLKVYDTEMGVVPDVSRLRARHFGFIFQELLLLEDLTCRENLRLARRLLGLEDIVKSGELYDKKWFRALAIESLMGKMVGECSGGQKQRVAVARALINDPDVIVADEPTSSLDRENVEKINEIFVDQHRQGKLILIVTHDDRQIYWGDCEKKILLGNDRSLGLEEKPIRSGMDRLQKGNPSKLQEKKACCPVCGSSKWKEISLMGTGVLVDVCGECQGVWLDRGELGQILSFPNQTMAEIIEQVEDIRKELEEASEIADDLLENHGETCNFTN